MSKDKQDYHTDVSLLRIKAEELLTEKEQEKSVAQAEMDAQKLLHELQVHQIELEMQNEELREANERAETALKRFTMLYDLAPMGYFVLEPDGTIDELNFTGAELLSDRRFSLVSNNFKLYIADGSKLEFNDFLGRIFKDKNKKSCKINLGYETVLIKPVYMEGVAISNENKCLLSVVDISSFQK
jgi:PAS domain-containing protein